MIINRIKGIKHVCNAEEEHEPEAPYVLLESGVNFLEQAGSVEQEIFCLGLPLYIIVYWHNLSEDPDWALVKLSYSGGIITHISRFQSNVSSADD